MLILCSLETNWIVIRNFNFAPRKLTLHEKIIKAAQREIFEGSGKLRIISVSRQGKQTEKKMEQYYSALFQNKRMMKGRTKEVSPAMYKWDLPLHGLAIVY